MKSNKAKWLSEEALQIAEERRETKSKGETERYIQLNTGFQRMAKRDKKGFFNEQCKETEENNRRGKTRVLLDKTIYIKGTFHPKMGTIKDSNGRDLEEAERSRRDRNPSSMNNAKKKRKTTEGEKLEISSRKLDISKKYCIPKWAQ